MSAQVTEAHPHQSLVRSFLHPEHWGTPLEACAIRLIADSEAAAKQSLLAAYDAVVVQRNRVTTERDRLRSELDAQCLLNAKGSEREAVLLGRVDRMAKECLNLRADLDAIKAIRNEETARAERAEAILGKLQELHGCSQEMVVHWCGHAAKRSIGLDKVQAELATEREKVRVLRDACESICEEWGRNHDASFCAGQRMETMASKALQKLEDAT